MTMMMQLLHRCAASLKKITFSLLEPGIFLRSNATSTTPHLPSLVTYLSQCFGAANQLFCHHTISCLAPSLPKLSFECRDLLVLSPSFKTRAPSPTTSNHPGAHLPSNGPSPLTAKGIASLCPCKYPHHLLYLNHWPPSLSSHVS